MQDKDIDHLFSTGLEHLEVEPTPKVWDSIVVELDHKKKSSSLMPLIRIAASVTIFLAAGLFFLLKNYKLPIDQPKDDLVKNRPVIDPVKPVMDQTKALVIKESLKPAITPVQKHSLSRIVNDADNYSYRLTAVAQTQEVIAEQKHGYAREDQQLLAAVTTTQVVVDHPVVPDEQLNIKGNITETDGVKTPVTVAGVDLPAAKPQAKKHGIRSLGDLINVVVARVDKRENKIIEFTNTTDDEAELTGLNLGIVRVKKIK